MPRLIEDDRGEPRPFVLERALRTVDASAVRPVMRGLALVTVPTVRGEYIAIGCAIGLGILLVFQGSGARGGLWAMLLCLCVACCLSWWRQRREVEQVGLLHRGALTAWMLGAGRCPCCATALVASGHVGVATCGGCSAAWRSDRIKSAPMPAESVARAQWMRRAWALRVGGIGGVSTDDAGEAAVFCRRVSRLRPDLWDDSELHVRCARVDQDWHAPMWAQHTFGALAIVGLVISIKQTGLGGTGTAVVLLIVALVVAFFVVRNEGFRRRRDALCESLCPSCAEDLASVESGPNGFVTCPLCSAAWRPESEVEKM